MSFRKEVVRLLIKMIEDFIKEKKAEGKKPSFKLMLQELRSQLDSN